MQGRLSSENEFQVYILECICSKGGTRMQLTISDLTTMMQKLDPKHNINLFRKQYGNTEKSLKEVKKPIYILDNMIVKLKPYADVKSLYHQGVMLENHWNLYDQTYAENEQKKIEVLKINNQNVCKVKILVDLNVILNISIGLW